MMQHTKKILLGFFFAGTLVVLLYRLLATERGSFFKGEALTPEEIDYLKSAGLLKEHEQVVLFSTFAHPFTLQDFKREGAFFTNKRIAAYRQTDHADDFTYFTFYPDICSMEFNRGDRLMTSPPSSILITRNNESSFRIFLDVPRSREFYEELLKTWESKRSGQ